MGGQIAAQRGDGNPPLKVYGGIGAGQGGAVLRPALDPQEPFARGRGIGQHAKGRIAAKALGGHLVPFYRCGGQGREVDVVEYPVIALLPDAFVQQQAHNGCAMCGGGLKRIIKALGLRAHVLRHRNCRDAVQSRLYRRTNGAGIQHIFGRIVAPVHPRQHQIGLCPVQHIIDPRQHAIGRAAFDGIAAVRQFGVDHRVSIADAMANAGLFEPDL